MKLLQEKNEMDQSAEEYKTLRAEILRNFDAMDKNLIACITSNGVALAYGVKESKPFVLALAVLIPVYFWVQHVNHRNAIAKLGAYISIFFEGNVTKLMWERRVHKVDLKHQAFHLPYFLRRFLMPYPVLLIISIAFLIWNVKPTNWPLCLALFLVSLDILIIWVIATLADVPYAKLREPWIEAFMELKSQEESENKTLA